LIEKTCRTFRSDLKTKLVFILISRVANERLLKFLGLKHLSKGDDILVVLTPSSKIRDVTLKRRLPHDSIIQKSFSSPLNPQTFELPMEKFIAGLLKLKAEDVELSNKQKIDYEKFEYQCYDRIHIPGTVPMKRSNHIVINGNGIKMGDSIFTLFLRLTLELKKKEGGWIDRHSLGIEWIVNDADSFQSYSNLRVALQGSLLQKDGQKFIESDGSKRYRISTHPDFITYNKEKLLKHPEKNIQEIAKRLPFLRKPKEIVSNW
jgi:hypothetical protein